jgi:RND family efflux transporter MFP subunit
MKTTTRLILFFVACAAPAVADDVEGFTEPYRTVNVGVTEVGIVAEMKVREGDTVRRGQALASLDQEVHLALLAIAEANMEIRGRLDSANAELDLNRDKLAKLQQLGLQGHARQEEIGRARTNVAIAEANVRTVEEELLVRRLEYDKMTAQLQRRSIRAPIDGVVIAVHKEVGEAVAPNNPELVTLVQLTSLRAAFSVPSAETDGLQTGALVKLRIGHGETPVEGTIEFLSPTIDAESGTVRVKVRVDNPNGKYRSGQRCSLEIPTAK